MVRIFLTYRVYIWVYGFGLWDCNPEMTNPGIEPTAGVNAGISGLKEAGYSFEIVVTVSVNPLI